MDRRVRRLLRAGQRLDFVSTYHNPTNALGSQSAEIVAVGQPGRNSVIVGGLVISSCK